MKVLKAIKNVIVTILTIIFFSFVIAMTILMLNRNDYGVTEFDTTSVVIIKDSIATEKYVKGDVVLVTKKKIENIKIGDEIFVYKTQSDKSMTINIGTVGELHPDEEAASFENGATYRIDYILGESTKVYHDIGTYLGVVQSKWGFLFIVLVPSFLIFIYELYAIIIEIKYGKEEEEKAKQSEK